MWGWAQAENQGAPCRSEGAVTNAGTVFAGFRGPRVA